MSHRKLPTGVYEVHAIIDARRGRLVIENCIITSTRCGRPGITAGSAKSLGLNLTIVRPRRLHRSKRKK